MLWSDTVNLVSAPEGAWFEMFATARDQALLKQQAGHDARGRKNAKPVLHYTLSWAASDNPSAEHMRETVLASLKAIKLDHHQALIAAHGDKDHLHAHVVVNTVDPRTGLTAPLKFTKQAFSRWAEDYERAHGVHVAQRIANNEARDNIRMAKSATRLLREALADQKQPMPYEPVKHKAVQREDWLDRKDIIERMRKLRKEIAPLLPSTGGVDVGDLWKRQLAERDHLDKSTEGAVDQARRGVFERYRPQWRDLYRSHKKELKHLTQVATHPFERAVYVFTQRERLGQGKSLTLRQMVGLIMKPERLQRRVEAVQQKERRSLASTEKSDKRVVSRKLWDQHRAKFDSLRQQQQSERKAARSERESQLRFVVTFDLAKETLLAERQAEKVVEPKREAAPLAPLAPVFETAVNTRSPTQMARVEAIKKQMEEWRQRNPGRDFGREM